MKSNTYKKVAVLVLVSVISILGIGVSIASAQYVPLESIGDVTAGEAITLTEYLDAIFKVGIGLAGVFAVLMIVIAGIEYIGGASSPSARSDAKNKIWNAIFGLILALGVWLVLNVINPDLLKTSLEIPEVTVTEVTEPTDDLDSDDDLLPEDDDFD